MNHNAIKQALALIGQPRHTCANCGEPVGKPHTIRSAALSLGFDKTQLQALYRASYRLNPLPDA